MKMVCLSVRPSVANLSQEQINVLTSSFLRWIQYFPRTFGIEMQRPTTKRSSRAHVRPGAQNS